MKTIKFIKMVASGNDFISFDNSLRSKVEGFRSLARKICDRKYGVGADGLLVLEKSRIADFRMRIFNADGSEAEMCGNGARCAALYWSGLGARGSGLSIETLAGIVKAEVKGSIVKINLTDPRDIKLDIPIKVNNRNLKVNLIDTGVPHAVIFVEGLDQIRVAEIGRAVRNHNKFMPRGTNADFVEVIGEDLIAIRTYERGVEDETLACGTGSVAAALIFSLKNSGSNKIKVSTKSGEVLKVYFDRIDNKFQNIWLEGSAKIIHKGVYYV
jgi:diaminopimelate epimerase